MRRLWLAILALVISATPASADLEIENVQAALGRLGPERKSTEYYPGDEVYFRYLVTGAGVDEVGKVDCSLAVDLTGPDGKTIATQSYLAQGILAIGGASFPGSASMVLPDKSAPGPYKLSVKIKDKQQNEEASFERILKVLPPDFAIITPRFSYDRAGKIDAPPGGTVDQTLFVRLRAIGFDRSRERIDTEMNIRVLDQDGKEVLINPIRTKLEVDDAEIVKQAQFLDFRGELFLNRPGDFILSVAVIDWIAKKTIKFETPLRIVPP